VPSKAVANMAQAFNIAEEKLGIAALLDPEGVCVCVCV
jgi:hypothetical protein